MSPRHRVQRRQADLGHAVALDDRKAGRGSELGQQLGRHLVGAGPREPQRREVAGLQVVVVDHGPERGGDHRHHRRLVVAQQRQDLVGVGGPGDDDPAADRERRQRPEERADVGHRRGGQEDVVSGQLEGGGGAGDHPAQRLARVGHPLRRTGRAGGEEDGGGTVDVELGSAGERLGGQQVVEAVGPAGRRCRRRACRAAAPWAAPATSSSGASWNTTVPRGSVPARAEAAMSAARSACATRAAAVETDSAWSISRAV